MKTLWLQQNLYFSCIRVLLIMLKFWQTPLKWCKCSVFNYLFIFPAWFCWLSVSSPSSDVIKRRRGRIYIWICDVMLLQVMYSGTWKQTSSVFPPKKPTQITPNSGQQKITRCRGFASFFITRDPKRSGNCVLGCWGQSVPTWSTREKRSKGHGGKEKQEKKSK